MAGELSAIIEDECDGVVAIEQYVRRGDELQRMVIGGHPVTMAVVHEGTEAETRCGAKSEYVVTWSISASEVNVDRDFHRYEAAVASACKAVAACRYDGGAFGRVVERPEYISWDVIHSQLQARRSPQPSPGRH